MKKSILLLEDDQQLSDTICQFLTYHDYDVLRAFDGHRAEDIAYEHSIDMMLLDVRVPLLDGFAFLKRLRNKGIQTPTIYITSLNGVEDVTKGFEMGCDDYIRKPFALKELLVRIESLLNRYDKSHNSLIHLSEHLQFNTQSLTLTQKGCIVGLKTKEKKLLLLFLQHPNELLEYVAIFKALWEYHEEPSHESLRTYIKSLRKLLGKEKIATVRNIGYTFVQQ